MRPETVKALYDAANLAMLPVAMAHHASASEVLTAYMTMAKSAVSTAKNVGMLPEDVRQAVEELMLECADEGDPM